MRRALAGFVLATLASGLFAGCTTTSFTDGARPGEVDLDGGGTVDPVAHQVLVQLPVGPLTIQIGKPTQTLTTVPDDLRAADGAKWVPVAWTLGGNGADYQNDTAAFQFQVTLVADGRRYALQAGQASDSDEAATKYSPIVQQKSLGVVVQGDGEHLSAEVEYDGVTQTADFDSGKIHSGVAAALYAKDAPHTALPASSCPLVSTADAHRFRVSSGTECSVGVVQTEPYVGGVGWVSSTDASWTLVPLDLHLILIYDDQHGGQYSDFDVRRVEVSVDGISPTTEILRYRSVQRLDVLRSGVLVFRTSSAPKSLHFTITYRAQDEYHPGRFHTFTAEHTYALS